MKSNRFIAIASALVAICLAVSISFSSRAADESKKADSTLPFTGKLLVVTTKDSEGGAYLTNPEIRSLRDCAFLVGKMAAPNSHWKSREGKTTWIPLNGILQIIEFDSLEEFQKSQD
jgi:hypothetical protein